MIVPLVVEHPLTLTKRRRLKFPDDYALKTHGRPIGSQPGQTGFAVMIPCDETVAVHVVEWLSEVLPHTEEIVRYRLLGCFSITTFAYRIERKFMGLNSYFMSASDAVQFKLSWANQLDGAF